MKMSPIVLVLAILAGMALVGCFSANRKSTPSDPSETKSDPTAQAKTAGYWKSFDKDQKQKRLKQLSSLQRYVTQDEGTERSFENTYWDNKKPGIYVDIVSGEPLFSSLDKYKSGTGWPSFTKPIAGVKLVEKEDRKLFAKRVEIRSPIADSHLGHVFDDGPAPTGKRYCMNSAAMRFVPVDQMEAQGYGQFLYLFQGPGGSK
ncbi:MAG: peptide-methionine (R)-S-oxide reductase [Bdellovibrionaceae bacterium]|nr:peptide-methionine (R)-S-oxide reductase [Pseudobdellovibrionaceae bacterium]